LILEVPEIFNGELSIDEFNKPERLSNIFIGELRTIGPLMNWQVGHLSANYRPNWNTLSMQFNCVICCAHT
jgi:hypothetical protein